MNNMNELKRNAEGYYDPTAYEALKGVVESMEIKRGDIFFIENRKNIIEYSSVIQDDYRPAIIVSNDTGNHFSNVVEVVYLTSQEKKALPTHCSVLCRVPSTALCEQVCTVSKDRIGDFIRTCTSKEMKKVDECLMVSLGLSGEQIQTPSASAAAVENEYKVQLMTERDLYKKLYEQMLEKMIG